MTKAINRRSWPAWAWALWMMGRAGIAGSAGEAPRGLDEATLASRQGVRRAEPLTGAAAWISTEGLRAVWGASHLPEEMAEAGINVIIEDFKELPAQPPPDPLRHGTSVPDYKPPPLAGYLSVLGGVQQAAQRFVAAASALSGVAADLQKMADHFLLIDVCSAVDGQPGPALVSIPCPPEEIPAGGGLMALGLQPPLEVTPGESYFLVLHTFAQAGSDGQAYRWHAVGDAYPAGEAWRDEGNGWAAVEGGQDWACEIEYVGVPPLRIQAPPPTSGGPGGAKQDTSPPPGGSGEAQRDTPPTSGGLGGAKPTSGGPGGTKPPPLDQLKAIAAADRCRQAGVRLFIAIDTLSPHPQSAIRNPQSAIRRAVDAAGRTCDVPCPREETLWREDLLPRVREIAAWSKEHGLAGLLFNVKMSDYDRLFYGDDLCFCDDCWRTFARPGKRVDLVRTPAAKRAHTLRDLGILDTYQRGLGRDVTRLAEQLRQAATGSNPDLLLGFVHGRLTQPGRDTADNWYYRALARGLARPEFPPLVFTYSLALTGHRDDYGVDVPAALSRWREEGLDVVHVNGLLLADHPLAQLQSILRKLRAETDGYWLSSFTGVRAEDAPAPSLPGSLAEYQAVLQAVNREHLIPENR